MEFIVNNISGLIIFYAIDIFCKLAIQEGFEPITTKEIFFRRSIFWIIPYIGFISVLFLLFGLTFSVIFDQLKKILTFIKWFKKLPPR